MSASGWNKLEQRALRCVAVQFFVNGAMFASFIPRLPEIRDELNIGKAEVGSMLSLAGLAGVLGSVMVGTLISRFGTKNLLVSSGCLLSVALFLVGVGGSWSVVVIGLAGLSLLDVLVDSAMNMQGSWLSARRAVPVLNRLHGLWSLGTMVGGVVASLLASAGVSLRLHLFVVSILLLALVVGYVRPGLLNDDQAYSATLSSSIQEGADDSLWLGLVGLGVAGFLVVAVETVLLDWSAFRFSDDFKTSAGFAASGYVAVAVGMTFARFVGDWFLVRLGRVNFMRYSIVMAACGLSLASLVNSVHLVFAGFVIAGAGAATTLPLLYDTAARFMTRSGFGLAALTAGLRIETFVVPVSIGWLTSSGVGFAIGVVTLPCCLGALLIAPRLVGGKV